MKVLHRVLLFSVVLGLVGCLLGQILGYSAGSEPQTVAHVDLERYVGKWYEIAAIPMFQERKCVGENTAEYTLLSDGRIKILNTCNGASDAEGRAEVVDKVTNAKLKVTFLDLLGWRFLASGDYWILDVDPDYQVALVGHPTRKYGWILSRTPAISKDKLRELAKKLQVQGYRTCDFRMTPQTGSYFKGNEELCTAIQEP